MVLLLQPIVPIQKPNIFNGFAWFYCGKESPGEPRRARESWGELGRAGESPRELGRALESQGEPGRARGSLGEPRIRFQKRTIRFQKETVQGGGN